MILYMISCKRYDSQKFFDVEAVIRKLRMSSAIRMCPLKFKYNNNNDGNNGLMDNYDEHAN